MDIDREKIDTIGAFYRLLMLRKRLFTIIDASPNKNSKEIEGTFTICFPNYLKTRAGVGEWEIRLYSYVVGPVRHYCWTGKILSEVVDKIERDIEVWTKDA